MMWINRAFLLSLLLLPLTVLSLNQDSLTYNIGEYKVFKNVEDARFYIVDGKKNKIYQNLKFVGFLASGMQVIDKNNTAFYLNHEMKKADKPSNFINLCGSVQHYTLAIIETEIAFKVMEYCCYDTTRCPGKKIASISKRKADNVYFINNQRKFNFTANYGTGEIGRILDPRTVVYTKDGKYALLGEKDNDWFDKITVASNFLKTELDGLFGIYGINQVPKYKSLEEFDYYLARFELPNGKTGLLDVYGKEYYE